MDVTRTWGFGKGRKRKARNELVEAAKRAERAEARKKRRARTAKRQVTCSCDAYPFPHRQGSEGAPSAATQKQRAYAIEREGAFPVMRSRLRRLVGFAKRRDAARWGWRSGGEGEPPPF